MGFFLCRDGGEQRVRLSELCDGTADCAGGFDEVNPLCAGHYDNNIPPSYSP